MLDRFYRSHRALLLRLAGVLVLEPASADRRPLQALELVRANATRTSELIGDEYTAEEDPLERYLLVAFAYGCNLGAARHLGGSISAHELSYTVRKYGGYGGIAYHHIADNYIALFSRFVPCGVWEAVYIIEGGHGASSPVSAPSPPAS